MERKIKIIKKDSIPPIKPSIITDCPVIKNNKPNKINSRLKISSKEEAIMRLFGNK